MNDTLFQPDGLLVLPQAIASIGLKTFMPAILARLGYRNVLVGNTSLAASAPSDEAGKLREALETIARNHDDFGTFSGTQCAEIARAALKAAKTARKM